MKMYMQYGPPHDAPTDSPDFDALPDADAGKDPMYTPDYKCMYNKGRGSMAEYKPRRASPTGGAIDPVYPMGHRSDAMH